MLVLVSGCRVGEDHQEGEEGCEEGGEEGVLRGRHGEWRLWRRWCATEVQVFVVLDVENEGMHWRGQRRSMSA